LYVFGNPDVQGRGAIRGVMLLLPDFLPMLDPCRDWVVLPHFPLFCISENFLQFLHRKCVPRAV
jgi:hypothetical protein